LIEEKSNGLSLSDDTFGKQHLIWIPYGFLEVVTPEQVRGAILSEGAECYAILGKNR
jgi:hypothetical protein